MNIELSSQTSPPARLTDCDYVRGEWSCRGSRYLWHKREETGEKNRYPCPVCNTETFLREAKTIAEKTHPALAACFCCTPTGPSGAAIWLAAVEVAMERNPPATREALAGIGRVKVFGDDASLEIFTYPATEPVG